jgi:hypothetical protein
VGITSGNEEEFITVVGFGGADVGHGEGKLFLRGVRRVEGAVVFDGLDSMAGGMLQVSEGTEGGGGGLVVLGPDRVEAEELHLDQVGERGVFQGPARKWGIGQWRQRGVGEAGEGDGSVRGEGQREGVGDTLGVHIKVISFKKVDKNPI